MDYEKLIPVSRPSIGEEELNEVRKVFDSGWLGMGRWVAEFEGKLKELLGADNAVAVNTGTTALHLALDSIGIEKGDEVIVPSLTFIASVQAIVACGAKPVFCDVEEDTLNMDIMDASRRITSKTKAIMPIHYSGQPCDMDAILGLAKKRRLRVVEDAAHAFGSYYKGKRIGSFGDITCFSFDPIKTITCGEGGAIVTKDTDLAHIMYKKRILGIDKDTWSRYKHKRDWFYNVTTSGFRYHMSNINAAIGLVQLKKLDAFISRRREIAKKYDEELGKIRGIILTKRDYDNIAPFNYIIKVKDAREDLMAFLKNAKIDTGVHYIPNHIQPLFNKSRVSLPITEKLYEHILTLPLYVDMTNEEQTFIIKKIKEFWKNHGKS